VLGLGEGKRGCSGLIGGKGRQRGKGLKTANGDQIRVLGPIAGLSNLARRGGPFGSLRAMLGKQEGVDANPPETLGRQYSVYLQRAE